MYRSAHRRYTCSLQSSLTACAAASALFTALCGGYALTESQRPPLANKQCCGRSGGQRGQRQEHAGGVPDARRCRDAAAGQWPRLGAHGGVPPQARDRVRPHLLPLAAAAGLRRRRCTSQLAVAVSQFPQLDAAVAHDASATTVVCTIQQVCPGH